MKQLITDLGDRLLARLVPSIEAGACCSDQGMQCACKTFNGSAHKKVWVYDCLCNCVGTTINC